MKVTRSTWDNRESGANSVNKDQILGGDAIQVLENQAFKMAVKKISDYLETKALNCKNDPEMAWRIIQMKQLNAKYLKELERIMNEGARAEPYIKEVEKKHIFQR